MVPSTAAAMLTFVMSPVAPRARVEQTPPRGCRGTSPRTVTTTRATLCTATKKAATHVPSSTLRKLTEAA